MRDITDHWYIYWGVLGSVGYMLYRRYKKTDPTQPRNKRLRSLLRGYQYYDPDSPSYDPDLPGRQLLLLLMGLVAIGFALLVDFLLRRFG